MRIKLFISAFLLIIFSSIDVNAQKENKYHKFEISILDATTQEVQAKYIQQINRIFQSKHCSYNSANSKFIFYTREYYTIEGIKEFLANNNVIADGNIKYTSPFKKVEKKQTTANN